MQRNMLLALVGVLAVQGSLFAQGPGNSQNSINWNMGNYNEENYLKGWYLYWPAEALLQPRRPMPYPWWPAHANSGIAIQPNFPTPSEDAAHRPAPQRPPGQLPIPEENQTLPPLPGNKTSYYPGYRGVQPVSYPQVVPSYWYGR